MEPHRPWAIFPIQVPMQAQAFFNIAIVTEVGNGAKTLFWADRWLHGQSIADLTDHAWVLDIRSITIAEEMLEFFNLWDLLYGLQLQPEVEDSHIWRLSSSGQYSAKSAFEGFFLGSTSFGPYERIWKSWAPPKCRFFMWLVTHDRCWTADRLAGQGLPHPAQCPLCDQEEETINHLLVSCVFAR